MRLQGVDHFDVNVGNVARIFLEYLLHRREVAVTFGIVDGANPKPEGAHHPQHPGSAFRGGHGYFVAHANVELSGQHGTHNQAIGIGFQCIQIARFKPGR